MTIGALDEEPGPCSGVAFPLPALGIRVQVTHSLRPRILHRKGSISLSALLTFYVLGEITRLGK